jgi:hypothetical protein
MRTLSLFLLSIACVACLAGCGSDGTANSGNTILVGNENRPIVDNSAIANRQQTPLPLIELEADHMVGRYPGLEEKYLDISKRGDKYYILIKYPGGIDYYDGFPKGKNIEITRNGKKLLLQKVGPAQTGLKWEGDVNECIVFEKGSEAFCR